MTDVKIRMAEITDKPLSYREAVAEGTIHLKKNTIDQIKNNTLKKGNPIRTAEIAGILTVKQSSRLIPLCHPIPITHVEINISLKETLVRAHCVVKSIGQTGVKMETLTGVTIALLTVWDMAKPLEKDDQGQYPTTSIANIRVVKKKKSHL